MAAHKSEDNGKIVTIKTRSADSVRLAQDVVVMAGDVEISDIISIDISKIEINSIVQATIVLNVKLG